MTLGFSRFLDAKTFARELDSLRAFRGEFMGDSLLEGLEAARLVIPHTRIRYPDSVARRAWQENHEGMTVKGEVEPDGARWSATADLEAALHRWHHARVYGPSTHPLDDPESRFMQFVERPADLPFRRWNDMRVDVSNDKYGKLFDGNNVSTFYTTWQLLLAAEVADMGIRCRVNLADPEIGPKALAAVDDGKLPAGHTSIYFSPAHAVRGFEKHRPALDAVVWFAEETSRALAEIVKPGAGRFQMTDAQTKLYDETRRQKALASSSKFAVETNALIELCRFLAGRWASWNRDGRPLVAEAYKDVLAKAVQFVQILSDLAFDQIRDRVGQAGGWFKPILDVIWPDWAEEQMDRVRRTLMASVAKSSSGDVSAADVDEFVKFLAKNNLEAFFWRVQSFEDHALRGNEFALEGMRSDIQGMAVAVEHVARALGGTEGQLYEMFKQLWRDAPEVLSVLKNGDVSRLAREGKLLQDWPALKARIDALRGQSTAGSIASDLVMAHRIRGGVHHLLPEESQFELERLFVGLMRAAALTFAEVQRTDALGVSAPAQAVGA